MSVTFDKVHEVRNFHIELKRGFILVILNDNASVPLFQRRKLFIQSYPLLKKYCECIKSVVSLASLLSLG